MKKEELYKITLMEVSRIRYLDRYHTIFLGLLLFRKMRHPEEKLKELTSKVRKRMEVCYSNKECSDSEDEKMREESMKAVNSYGQNFGKTNILQRTDERCLEQLESALEQAVLPEEWKITGHTVEDVLNYMISELPEYIALSKIKGLDDESIKFYAELVIRKKYHPELELRENIWETLKKCNMLKENSGRSKEDEIDYQFDTMELMLRLKNVKFPSKWEIKKNDPKLLEKMYEHLTQ